MGIGPSTKETTLHHFRDPLLDVVSNDNDIDLLGVIIVGTPQENQDKIFVAQRAAAWIEAMRADGVIVSIDGWGNSNIDFASLIQEVGERDIPIVGMSFVGTQAQFVVTNKYMDTIVDFNKSKDGVETEVVGENNIVELDAKKALAFLKLKMNRIGGERK
ncbi:proline reductase [Clostridium fermenticellae]|uniref:Proline reductase n=1 Tax=Clostridium fermenticellae TaxID=2068654 RepID=A0A386H0I1_9CLOT|nr:glycine/sarcosine/betaine reductase component B subunit [Clostridium fermenticellae]AYD39150.1 proline reductase [Clostridium fermenticellae]